MNREFKIGMSLYFKHKLNMFNYTRGWLKGDCPFCGKHNKFGVQVFLNKTNCFVCNEKYKPLELVAYLENVSVPEAQSLIRKINISDINTFEYKDFDDYVIKDIHTINYPDGFLPFTEGNDTMAKLARQYITKRGFDYKELSRRGWGYCIKDKYFGYIIIPYFYNGNLVYFNARKYVAAGPKYNNPTIDEEHIGKSLLIYNIDALYIFDKIYLCEGAINARTIGDAGIATAGKKLSDKQIDLILKSPVTKVVSLLDPDALEDSIKLGMTIIKYGKQYKLIRLPDGEDVNSLGKKKTMKYIYKSKYLTYSDLIKMKNDYERSKLTY